MIGFVTSLPHPDNCASYERRCELLAITMRSILAQTNPDIRLVIVVNAEPASPMPDDARVEVVRVPYDPPHKPEGTPVITDAMYADKGAKLGVGTAVAARAGADYIMFVDSDDFISRRIGAFSTEHAGPPGWFSDAGYFHVQGARSVTPVAHDFHQRNGSTHILRTDLIGVPEDTDITAPRDAVIEHIGRTRVRSLMGDHKWIVAYFAKMGEPLAPLPFPGAIWEIGTGENFSQVLTASGRKQPVEGPIAHEFGLPVPTRMQALQSQVSTVQARIGRRLARRRESLEDLRERIQVRDEDPGPASPA